jgi:hypothetical protein
MALILLCFVEVWKKIAQISLILRIWGSSIDSLQVNFRGISKGFLTRRKIHKYASFATLPLLAAESIVGQKLLDGDGNASLRSAHSGLATGIGVLFGVETITGVWNMMEMRKYPGNKKRLFHGIPMLAADAGFFAAAVTAPGHDREERSRDVSTHKALAYASFGSAAFSYVYMLIAK